MSLLKKSKPSSEPKEGIPSLETPLSSLFRLSPDQKSGLSRLGIETVFDILHYFPKRYSDISAVTTIKSLTPGAYVTIYGKVKKISAKKSYRTKIPMTEATIDDGTGVLRVVWFRQPYISGIIEEGQLVRLTGPISLSGKRPLLTNPEVESAGNLPIDVGSSLFDEGTETSRFGFPLYGETKGVTSKFLYHTIIKLIKLGILDQITDPIPETIKKTYKLPDKKTAVHVLHMPKNQSSVEAARKRMAFEEIFLIQIERARNRFFQRELETYTSTPSEKNIAEFVARFPFDLTEGQDEALSAIISDMKSGHPMARLLEGDVGSGKTAVAAAVSYAMVMTRPMGKDFGNCQVAYMAPTEILAVQLYENFIENFKHLPIQIALITGKECRKFPSKTNPETWTKISKPQLLKWVANGEIAIVVGTHALIQKTVAFKHLGLVVIDEQHRFGTNQRSSLARKGGFAPHLLSMTATPIPRTLALTMYGDLDLSIISDMPPGRKPVITKIVSKHERKSMYENMQRELQSGRQVYVICPRIDEPDPRKEMALQAKSVTSEAEALRTLFPGKTIDILHSKMTKDEKESTMKEFLEHKIDILVATSVVEVGVNVPNATVIIIEGAERFGLAQLHQLRGRVIRGTHQAYCYLSTDTTSSDSLNRLKALEETGSGFELAEKDLLIRGAGELSGGKQWGISDIGMEALRNPKLVEFARTEAQAIVEVDPQLSSHQVLREEIARRNVVIHFE
jgi:ATP-dependent DNA helicase RecG